jgi:SPP1 family predicted phage head-tail adaptor
MAGIPRGELNRTVRFERKTTTEDGHGGQTTTWGLLRRQRVKAGPIGGKEALTAGTLQASQGWRLEMDVAQVTTEDRAIMDGVTLNIRSVVDPTGRRERLILLCDTLASP